MLMYQDVEDDLIEKYPDLYTRDGIALVYQNGADNPRYIVTVQVHPIYKDLV
jgi:hypothetical protein